MLTGPPPKFRGTRDILRAARCTNCVQPSSSRVRHKEQKICLAKFSGKSRRRRRLREQSARLLAHARMSAIAVQVSYPATIELDD